VPIKDTAGIAPRPVTLSAVVDPLEVTEVTPANEVASIATLGDAEAVITRFSMPEVITPEPEFVAVPAMVNVSLPAPPTSESPAVSVALEALNESSAPVPVKFAPKSVPVVSGLIQQKAIYLIFWDFYTIHFESFDPSMTLPRLRAHPKASMQRS